LKYDTITKQIGDCIVHIDTKTNRVELNQDMTVIPMTIEQAVKLRDFFNFSLWKVEQ